MGEQAAPSVTITTPPVGRRSRSRSLAGTSAVAVGLFLCIWELTAQTGWIHPLFISSPSRVLVAAAQLMSSGALWPHLWASLAELTLGFGAAIVVGVPLGILLGWHDRAFAAGNPFVAALNATPRVALMPLIIVWLGIGIWSKVAVVFLGGVFPIILNMMTAMRTVDLYLLKAARSFNATDAQVFWTLALPSSVPFLVAGLRLGAGRALVGIVVAEMYVSNVGLGFLISRYGSTLQTDKLFVGICLITMLGVLLDAVFRRLEKRYEAWRS